MLIRPFEFLFATAIIISISFAVGVMVGGNTCVPTYVYVSPTPQVPR